MIATIRRQVKPDWMSRDVMLLISARTSMSIGRSLAGVTVPIYLASIGFTGARLGLLFAITSLASGTIAALVGLLSDRFGRKPFVVLVPLVTAVSALVFGFTSIVPLIFLFGVIGTLGQGQGAGGASVGPYSPAEQAVITDATPTEHRNSMFGRLAFAAALGSLIGSPLAGISDVARHLGVHGAAAYHPAFVLTSILAVVAALLAVPIANPRIARKAGRNPFSLPKRSWPFLLRFWVVIGVNGVALGFFSPFVTYWFHVRYGAGAAEIGVLYSIINVLTMISNLSAARVARRLGLVRAISTIWVLQAIWMVPMVLAPTFWMAGAFYFLRQLFQRVQMPLRQSYVMGMVAQEERGAVAGLYQLPSQLASGVAPIPAGYIFDNVSMSLPFEITTLLQSLVGLLFFTFFHRMAPPEETGRHPPSESLPESAASPTEPAPAPDG